MLLDSIVIVLRTERLSRFRVLQYSVARTFFSTNSNVEDQKDSPTHLLFFYNLFQEDNDQDLVGDKCDSNIDRYWNLQNDCIYD